MTADAAFASESGSDSVSDAGSESVADSASVWGSESDSVSDPVSDAESDSVAVPLSDSVPIRIWHRIARARRVVAYHWARRPALGTATVGA